MSLPKLSSLLIGLVLIMIWLVACGETQTTPAQVSLTATQTPVPPIATLAASPTPTVADVQVSSRTLDAARFVLENREFRKSLILDTQRPVGYPEQLRQKFNLSTLEIAAVCVFAERLDTDENAKLAEKNGIAGFVTNPSPDFWATLRAADANTAGKLSDKIEKLLDLTFATPYVPYMPTWVPPPSPTPKSQ